MSAVVVILFFYCCQHSWTAHPLVKLKFTYHLLMSRGSSSLHTLYVYVIFVTFPRNLKWQLLEFKSCTVFLYYLNQTFYFKFRVNGGKVFSWVTDWVACKSIKQNYTNSYGCYMSLIWNKGVDYYSFRYIFRHYMTNTANLGSGSLSHQW